VVAFDGNLRPPEDGALGPASRRFGGGLPWLCARAALLVDRRAPAPADPRPL